MVLELCFFKFWSGGIPIFCMTIYFFSSILQSTVCNSLFSTLLLSGYPWKSHDRSQILGVLLFVLSMYISLSDI